MTDNKKRRDTPSWTDEVTGLHSTKADKQVVEVENSRLMDRINFVERDIKDMKGRVLASLAKHDSIPAEVKVINVKVSDMQHDIGKTDERLASLQKIGFRLITAIVASLFLYGASVIVWSVKVGATADEAVRRLDRIEKAPRPIIMAAPPGVSGDSSGNRRGARRNKDNAQQVPVETIINDAVTKAMEEAVERVIESKLSEARDKIEGESP